MSENKPIPSVTSVAAQLATLLQARRQDYALGGALALGYWSEPCGTVDVNLTLFLPADRPAECLEMLADMGCDFSMAASFASLREHGFCRVAFAGLVVYIFLPTLPFYEAARARRREVQMADQAVLIWDAETLAVFKRMFFRRKDLADVVQIIRDCSRRFDHAWVRQHLADMYGARDPRLSAWDQLVQEAAAENP